MFFERKAEAVNTLIFDLGDVLFSWSPHTTTTITPSLLKKMMGNPIWYQYECARITQHECYTQCSTEFDIPASEIYVAFAQARASLQANDQLIHLIKNIRKESPEIRVFAMSNISSDDYEFLRKERSDTSWSIFDEVFTSAKAGTRKPNISFFDHVLDAIGGSPEQMFFIDDREVNVFAARSCGLNGVVYNNRGQTSLEPLERILRNAIFDPIERGGSFLTDNKQQLHTYIDDGTELSENFAQLLIYEMTRDESLISITKPTNGSLWNYFQGAPIGTTTVFPCDLDTNSIALSAFPIATDKANAVMDRMLQYVNEDGIIMTYFDDARPRTDPVVCINVSTLFSLHGRQDELRNTVPWVINVLRHRAYLEGTRYYCTAEAFLYFFHRYLQHNPVQRRELGPLLLDRTLERVGQPGDALARAMRIIILASFGESTIVSREMDVLRDMQEIDGGWEISWIYKYGASGARIGSRGLSTAFALAALRDAREMESNPARSTGVEALSSVGFVGLSTRFLHWVARTGMSWVHGLPRFDIPII